MRGETSREVEEGRYEKKGNREEELKRGVMRRRGVMCVMPG